MDDLLAAVEVAAGLAVFGGSPASARREPVVAGTAGPSAGADGRRHACDLLPQLAVALAAAARGVNPSDN